MTIIKDRIIKVDRRTKKTKKAIKEAFMSLMTKHDISKITIKDISDQADINRKTFYAYYSDVYAVLDEIENDIMEKVIHLLDDSNLEKIILDPSEFFHKLTDIINEDLNFYELFLNTMALNTMSEKIKGVIKEKFVHLLSDKTTVDHHNLNFMIEFLVSGLVASYKEWFHSDRSTSLEDLSKQISLMITNGMSALINQ